MPLPRRPRQKYLEEIVDPISGKGGCVVLVAILAIGWKFGGYRFDWD